MAFRSVLRPRRDEQHGGGSERHARRAAGQAHRRAATHVALRPRLDDRVRHRQPSGRSAAPIPTAELLEAVGRWPDEAAELAATVPVPVHYLALSGVRAPVVHRCGLGAQLRCVLHRRSTRCQRADGRDRPQRRPSPRQPRVPPPAARLRTALRAAHRPSSWRGGRVSRVIRRWKDGDDPGVTTTERRRQPRGRREPAVRDRGRRGGRRHRTDARRSQLAHCASERAASHDARTS